jgi:preprotein translocase SecE subunit
MKNKNSKTTKTVDGIVKSEDIMAAEPKEIETQKKTTSEVKKTEKIKPVKQKNMKKTGFIGGVINELKLVEWPSFKYVAGWSTTIILFTALIGSVLGFTDYYFESGVKFVDCTSPNGSKNQSLQDCAKDLTSDLTFQKYFNRDASKTAAPVNTTSTPAESANPELTQPTITSDPKTVITPETNKVNTTDTTTKK